MEINNHENADFTKIVRQQRFTFNVITVDIRGEKVKCDCLEAECFTEELKRGITLEMVTIPGGKFMMGALPTEPCRFDWEKPQKEVKVLPFFMGKYPVTQNQWAIVAEFPEINMKLHPDPSKFKGNNLPVENVSWFEAVEFCNRLAKSTGKNYRLPSESEWEYACKAGTTTPFHFGETITSNLANYAANCAFYKELTGECREKTTPVGSFEIANPFGLYDMHGNVFEWCDNRYSGSSKIFSYHDKKRVIRGGSWMSHPWYCRSAFPSSYGPEAKDNCIGFRVVVSDMEIA